MGYTEKILTKAQILTGCQLSKQRLANEKAKQESCAIAEMTAQCAPYMGALKIFGTP